MAEERIKFSEMEQVEVSDLDKTTTYIPVIDLSNADPNEQNKILKAEEILSLRGDLEEAKVDLFGEMSVMDDIEDIDAEEDFLVYVDSSKETPQTKNKKLKVKDIGKADIFSGLEEVEPSDVDPEKDFLVLVDSSEDNPNKKNKKIKSRNLTQYTENKGKALYLVGDENSFISDFSKYPVGLGYVVEVNAVDDSAEVIPSDWKCTDIDGELPGGATPGELYEGKLYVENGSGGYYVFEYVGEGRVDEQTSDVVTLREDLASDSVGTGSKMIAFIMRAVGAVNRWVEDKLSETVSIEDFGGGAGKTSNENTEAAARAIAHLVVQGGGVLNFQAGEYEFACQNPGVSEWDNRAAIWHNTPGVGIKLKGKGRGVTILKLADGQNAHLIKGGQRTGGTVAITGLQIEDLTLDQNRENQDEPDDTLLHNNVVDIASGASGVEIRRVRVQQGMYYGIGFQRDGIKNCLIDDVEIDSTGADAIDWKDDSDASTGNVIRNLRVSNWGLLDGLSTGQAGIDLRSGIRAFDVSAESPGPGATVGLRLQNGTPGASPVQATKVYGFRGVGDDRVNTVGARVISRNAMLMDAHVTNFADGYSLSNPDARFIDLRAEYNNVGFRLWQDSVASAEADTACLIGLVARNNVQAGIVYDSVDEITVLGADVRNNGIGHDIRTGSNHVRIIGGSCAGNTTALQDNGTNTIVQYVSGLRTRSVVSADVEIDTTGTKSITIAHNLNVTPSPLDVTLTLRRNTNVGDWEAGFLWVVGVDATNIYAQLRVATASSTPGAVVGVMATIEAKARG